MVWEDGAFVWVRCVGKWVKSIDAVVLDWKFVWGFRDDGGGAGSCQVQSCRLS